jgi:hypothetical protein
MQSAVYDQIIGDSPLFRGYLEQAAALYPELFPSAFTEGYWLHDVIHSKKMTQVPLRRVKLTIHFSVSQAQPSRLLR